MKHNLIKANVRLINKLKEIEEQHSEIGDTDVREQMRDIIESALIKKIDKYKIPNDVGMFKDDGNTSVLEAIKEYLKDKDVLAVIGDASLSEDDRLELFQSGYSDEDDCFVDEYFGDR